MGKKQGMGIGSPKSFGVILEKKGLFDFYKLYNIFLNFFKSYKYFSNEKDFSTKTKPQGKDYTIEYSGERKITNYLKFYIDVRIEIRGAKTLNIKTHKKQRGHVIVRFKAYYEKDYMNKWKYFPFLKKLYEEYIIKQKILDYEGKLWAETNNLITKTKKALGLMPRK